MSTLNDTVTCTFSPSLLDTGPNLCGRLMLNESPVSVWGLPALWQAWGNSPAWGLIQASGMLESLPERYEEIWQ